MAIDFAYGFEAYVYCMKCDSVLPDFQIVSVKLKNFRLFCRNVPFLCSFGLNEVTRMLMSLLLGVRSVHQGQLGAAPYCYLWDSAVMLICAVIVTAVPESSAAKNTVIWCSAASSWAELLMDAVFR